MYESYFGLQETPFALTPDTRYFLRAETHRQALELLLAALQQREGFIKISGEVGTGKTLLCRMLLNALEGNAVTAYIPNPHLSPDGLYEAVADELGVDMAVDGNTHRRIKAISERLIMLAEDGRTPVLVIDEAQAMPEETIESLRLLTNLETERAKLLQVVLFGQPELDTMLDRPSLRQLKQRITFQQKLQPLDRPAVAQYLQHRLAQAGYNGPVLFEPVAVKMIGRASGGIPRLVNILAHKALLAAWGRGDRAIGRWHVRQAIRDTDSVQLRRWYWLGSWT